MKIKFEMNFPNFEEGEFKCKCGCGKKDIDPKVVYILQYIRNKYGKAVIVKSGCRCQKANDATPGSIKTSDHVSGKAADFQILPYCTTLEGRKSIMENLRSLPGFKYAYCNGWILYADGTSRVKTAPNMGNSIHISVN